MPEKQRSLTSNRNSDNFPTILPDQGKSDSLTNIINTSQKQKRFLSQSEQITLSWHKDSSTTGCESTEKVIAGKKKPRRVLKK